MTILIYNIIINSLIQGEPEVQLFNRCYQFLIFGLLVGGIFSMNAQENAGAPETEHSIKISQWLKTEPFSAPVPALAGDDFKLSQMLGFEPVDIATITNDQLGLSWSELAADESGNVQLSGSGDQPQRGHSPLSSRRTYL